VLTLSDLDKSLGIKDSNCEGFVQLAVTENLGGHSPHRSISFQYWIVFNVREQQFKVVYGIQVAELRKLIYIDPNKPIIGKNQTAIPHIYSDTLLLCNVFFPYQYERKIFFLLYIYKRNYLPLLKFTYSFFFSTRHYTIY